MDQGPTEAAQLFEEAVRHQMAGELGEAIRLYKRSIAAHPTAEAYTFLGWSYSSMGRVQDAIAQCKKAIGLDPEYALAYAGLSNYFYILAAFGLKPAREVMPLARSAAQKPRC